MTTSPSPSPAPSASSIPRAALFVVSGLLCAVPWGVHAMSAIALGAGIGLGLLGWTCWPAQTKVASRWLIQGAIVLLGLRIDFSQLLHAAGAGLGLAIATIAGAMLLGWLLARLLRVGTDLGLLISAGTAICGGSAIAAVGSAIRARASDMAIATAVVFVLNAVGVVLLPSIGRAVGLSGSEFGTWAGVAVHDLASVGAVAKDYARSLPTPAGESGPTGSTLDQANIVKLSRVLWIVPIALAAAWWAAKRQREGTPTSPSDPARRGRAPVPWFIGLFVLATLVRSLAPGIGAWHASIAGIAGVCFQLALFLIGAGVTRSALMQVGWRAAAQGAIAWIALAGATLAWVMLG